MRQGRNSCGQTPRRQREKLQQRPQKSENPRIGQVCQPETRVAAREVDGTQTYSYQHLLQVPDTVLQEVTFPLLGFSLEIL